MKKRRTKSIAFTGGGTAGHVYPAFPVLERLRQAGYRVFWIGSLGGMERQLIENAGIPYYGIPAGKLRRYWSWKNIIDPLHILRGILHSWSILRKENPQVLFSKGGFVSVPPLAAARFMRIPALTHESDVDPGLATRMNIRLGARALLSYEKTLSCLSSAVRARALVTGNPVRDSIFKGNPVLGRQMAKLSPDDPRPLLMVMGGSQGAKEINSLISAALDKLLEYAAIVHKTGPGYKETEDPRGYLSRPFFTEEIPHLLAAANIALSRSGAGAVWEMAASRTPALFIPLREASRGDQLLNAAIAEENGFSLTLEKDLSPGKLARIIHKLLHDEERMKRMSAACETFPAARAADSITAAILEEIP